MSGPERADAVVETTRGIKRKHLPTDDQDDLEALDSVFKRIKTAVPRTPYVLSTPSLHPYTYHSRQEAYAWMLGHLWRHDEEHMQYRTYLYREPCQDCFELQAGEDDEPEQGRSKPLPNKADNQPVKRKPNLSAFKVKQANGTAAPPTVKPSSPPPAPTKHAPEQSNGVTKAEKQSAPPQKPGAKSPIRASNGVRDERRAEKIKTDATQSESRVHATTSRPKSDSVGSKTASVTPHGLPPMLSPVEEPLRNPHGLPDILSPTLPSNIQAELDRLDVQRKRAESDVSTSSSDRKTQSLAVPPANPPKPEAPVKTENRIRSVSIKGTSPNPAPVRTGESGRSLVVTLKFSKAKISTVKNLLRLPPKKKPEQKESHDAPAEREKERAKETLIDRGKERAKEVPADRQKDRADREKERAKEALVDREKDRAKEAPVRPPDGPVIKKKAVSKVAARRGDTATSAAAPLSSATTSARPTTTSTRLPEKRPRAEEEATLSVPSKRPRALSQQDRPITPTPATSSPAPAAKTSSTQQSQTQYLTPKKEPKGLGMLRTASSESYDATPGRSGATPAGAKADPKAGPTSAPVASKKQADISLLSQTSMKLNQMGRALKHEATKILTAGGKIDKQDEKRAAITNLECILSYMAAYYAQDLSLHLRNRPGEVEQTWKTLLPLCLSYARCTKDFPHLDGLRSYLSSTIASAICTHVAQRANPSRTATSHDSPQDLAPSDLAKHHPTLADNFGLLSDHLIKMARHFQDARAALPMDDLQSLYKKTWAQRETNPRLLREEPASAALRISNPSNNNNSSNGVLRMSGPYFLPLAADTSPIQAVRFGLRFLAEYCEREGIEYRFRVCLERSE